MPSAALTCAREDNDTYTRQVCSRRDEYQCKWTHLRLTWQQMKGYTHSEKDVIPRDINNHTNTLNRTLLQYSAVYRFESAHLAPAPTQGFYHGCAVAPFVAVQTTSLPRLRRSCCRLNRRVPVPCRQQVEATQSTESLVSLSNQLFPGERRQFSQAAADERAQSSFPPRRRTAS